MSYTPPDGDNVNFEFEGGYTAPAGNNVDFQFGVVVYVTIDHVSRDTLYDDQVASGFHRSRILWTADGSGDYRVEMGGNGAFTGDLLKTGRTYTGLTIKTELTDADLEAAPTFSGTGDYRFNVYVEGDSGVWTPYE